MVRGINEVTQATTEGAAGTNRIVEKSSIVVNSAMDVVSCINSSEEVSNTLKQLVSKFNVK